jgi:uncharacterized protein (TIGR00255 family)
MIKSMTGFASLTSEDDAATVMVTVRSVNHRYLDIQVRAPKELSELEREFREIVQAQVARGHVELTVALQFKTAPSVGVEVNESLVAALSKAAEAVRRQGWVSDGLTAGDVLRFPQVVMVRQQPVDAGVWQRVCATITASVARAMTELDSMRRREGEFLRADLEGRCVAVRTLIDRMVSAAAAGQTNLRERLEARISELEADVQVEPAAVVQEVVRWAARSDVHEEITRLRGHLDHLTVLADGDDPCGRKLDFLLQEMNREVNTVGSKAEGPQMVTLVIEAKAELEKLREQTQNVE